METAKQIYQNIQDGSLDLNVAESGVQQKSPLGTGRPFFLFFFPFGDYRERKRKDMLARRKRKKRGTWRYVREKKKRAEGKKKNTEEKGGR